jgi:hypothetical protein
VDEPIYQVVFLLMGLTSLGFFGWQLTTGEFTYKERGRTTSTRGTRKKQPLRWLWSTLGWLIAGLFCLGLAAAPVVRRMVAP